LFFQVSRCANKVQSKRTVNDLIVLEEMNELRAFCFDFSEQHCVLRENASHFVQRVNLPQLIFEKGNQIAFDPRKQTRARFFINVKNREIQVRLFAVCVEG
jgi:hypothetical protein